MAVVSARTALRSTPRKPRPRRREGQADHGSRPFRRVPGDGYRRVTENRAAVSPISRVGRTTTNTPSPRSRRTVRSSRFPTRRGTPGRIKTRTWATKFVCVQSVVVDDTGALWVLDTGNPGMNGTLAGAPKLVKIDPGFEQGRADHPFRRGHLSGEELSQRRAFRHGPAGGISDGKRRGVHRGGGPQKRQGAPDAGGRTNPRCTTKKWT